MAKLLGFDLNASYSHNVAQLKTRGIVVWDVIGECERPGSLDSAIVKGSERLNPISQLLTQYPGLSRIALNGGTAARLFKKHLQPEIDLTRVTIFNCPSTSPANARMNFEAKCSAWRVVFVEQDPRAL